MPPHRAQIQSHAAEHAERAVEPVARVAFLQQPDDVGMPRVAQLRLDVVADADYLSAVFLGEIKILESRVHFDE